MTYLLNGCARVRPWLGTLFVLLLASCAGLTPAPEPVSEKPTVVALLESARSDVDAGRIDAATATVERALRIEPRNAALWHELANLRLRAGESEQAASLAAKSNALAGGNRALKAKNWRLIAQVRSDRGDVAGASEAWRKAEELEHE